MTKVIKNIIKCSKCGKESEQQIVCSVNYLLGTKEDNDRLMNHKQKCPYCNYEAVDIARANEKSKTPLKRELIIAIKNDFIKEKNLYKSDLLNKEIYLKYLNKIEELLKNHSYCDNDRFYLSYRTNVKWIDYDDAMFYLFDNIEGIPIIHPHEVSQGKNLHEIIIAQDNYYKEDNICTKEKELMLGHPHKNNRN